MIQILYFFVSLKFGACYITIQWWTSECYFTFSSSFMAFFIVFHNKIFVFIIFISFFFGKVYNFCNIILTILKQESRNCWSKIFSELYVSRSSSKFYLNRFSSFINHSLFPKKQKQNKTKKAQKAMFSHFQKACFRDPNILKSNFSPKLSFYLQQSLDLGNLQVACVTNNNFDITVAIETRIPKYLSFMNNLSRDNIYYIFTPTKTSESCTLHC